MGVAFEAAAGEGAGLDDTAEPTGHLDTARRHRSGLPDGSWPEGADMRILIADADPTSRLLLEANATKLGHRCLVAEDGASAWDLLAQGGIDVLLAGCTLPGLDGPELCRRVREDAADDYVYVALTTGPDHPERVLEGMHAGADDALMEPVDPLALETRLVAAARVTELHRALARARGEVERVTLELLEQTLTDELTGLRSRRRMEDDLARAHARAARVGRTYGVALFDIDHFTLYNDHYGRAAGDETLRRVAATIDFVVRAGECAYRCGGEQFLILMPDCRPTDSIFMTGERIRQAVVEVAIPHGARPSSPSLVTLTGGVSCWSPGSPLTPDEVFEEAGEALVQAKSDGRNRVYAAPSVDGIVDQVPVFTAAAADGGSGRHDREGGAEGAQTVGRLCHELLVAAGSPRASQVSVASTSQPKRASARQASRTLVARVERR